jgi:hypothetical protein
MMLTYTPNPSSGLPSIEIPAYGTPFEIVRDSLFGFGGVRAQHFVSQSPTQNGAAYFASRYDSRSIMFSFRISAGSFDEMSALKRQVSRTFSSAFGEGVLRIYVDIANTVYFDINCIPDGVADMFRVLKGAPDKYCLCQVSLTAYSPFWRDSGGVNTITFGTVSGGFKLPFSFPFTLGEQGVGGAINQGSVPTPALITIEGAGSNPVVTNTRTGEYISINYAAQDGDSIVVNTAEDITSVTHYAADGTLTDIFNTVELGSSFFQLLPGLNEITVTDAGATVPQTITIEWDNLYLGVF